MVMYMKVNGSMTKLMEKELIPMLMELTTMETGLMISNMDTEWSPGLMVPSMKAIMLMVKKKAKES